MKPKEILYLLGWKPPIRTYGYTVRDFLLEREGPIQYAQWLHPGEKPKHFIQSQIDELRTFLKPGDAALDIGAHTGDTSIPIALAVGKTGRVFALEPNPYVFEVLKKNASLNPDTRNIVPLPFAATAEDAMTEFEYSDSGFCNGGLHEGISKWKHGHAFRLKVEGKNLENYLRNNFPEDVSRIHYIKVDAEGYDFTILKSLSSLIDSNRPYIKAEIFKWTNLHSRLQMHQWLTARGYRIFRVEGESRYRGQVVEATDLEKWKHFDIFCDPGRQTS